MPWDDLGSSRVADGVRRMCVQFFFVARGKILILLPLGELDRPLIGQNIGTKGVGRKILRNKALATQIRPAAFWSDWF